MSIVKSSAHSRLKRPAMLVSAGLLAAALVAGGSLAANAEPAPTIALSTSTVSVNASVQVTVDGFQPNEAVTFSLDSAQQNTGNDKTDAQGHLVEYIYIPTGTTLGAHTVHATGATTAQQSADVTVIASPKLTLSAATVTFSQLNGSGITATVTGYTPGEKVQFGYGTGQSGSDFGDPVTADANGVATISLTSQVLFGAPVTEARTISISSSNADFSVASTSPTLTIVADASPSVPAAPAVAVKGAASFTG